MKMHELLRDPGSWTKGVLARDEKGLYCELQD